MNNLIAARSQMALSLGFHIVFSCIGIVMPFLMATAELCWLRTKDEAYLRLAKMWSRGVAIFFATGAVSGTVLSFELGMLWPGFMAHAGPIIGMPFSLEGTAFFMEAIALGFFMFGWKRLPPWLHWFTGLSVGIFGVISAILVLSANAWMNHPSGFDYINGQFSHIHPIQALFNPGWFPEALHMTVAAFVATGFGVAGIHAFLLLKGRNSPLNAKAFKIAAVFAGVAALVQPISGDHSARFVAQQQPAKLAAMEAHYYTSTDVPLIVGGIPDNKAKKVNYAIQLPGMLSFLVAGNVHAKVTGLDQFPVQDQPPVTIAHFSFQIMVALGTLLAGIASLYFFGQLFRRRWRNSPFILRLFILSTPLGFLAVEAGWTLTEVGRQPWIIQGIMRTADAVTPMPGIEYTFILFTFVYVLLDLMVVFMLLRQIKSEGVALPDPD
jgi:cytochrome bd ubiquinol oxidase subunit I